MKKILQQLLKTISMEMEAITVGIVVRILMTMGIVALALMTMEIVVLILMMMEIITMRIRIRTRITQQKIKMKIIIIIPMIKMQIKLHLLTKQTTIREIIALIHLKIILLKPLIIQIGNRI